MVFRFIAVAPYWFIAVRSGPGRLRAVSGTESARSGISSQQGQQSLGFAGCGGRQSRSGRQCRVSAPAATRVEDASSTYCRALGVAQTGAGWFDGSLAHPVRSGRDSLRCICHGPAAGDERDGAAAPALAASAAGHPARLRTGHGRESHGR